MMDLYTPRHRHQRAARDADQVELDTLKRGATVFDAGVADERIAGALEDLVADNHINDLPRFQQQDLGNETAVGDVAAEIVRRQRLMGAAYPFEVTENALTYSASKSGFYEFCLAAVSAPTITTGSFVEFPRRFERATSELLRLFLGSKSSAFHTGAPRDNNLTTFKKGMVKLNEVVGNGEWRWSPEDGLPQNPTITGDEGIDFAVWLPMLDKRAGGLFVLGQCACGGDWLDKWSDLNLKKLEKWFRPMTYAEPVRAFATPHHVVDGLMHEATREAGLVFDRARLVLISELFSNDPAWLPWKAMLDQTTQQVFNSAVA